MPKLDVSLASPEQKEQILKYAAETRRFEIERFWQRSLFFWGFIGAAFVAYVALNKDGSKGILSLSIACFGVVCSVAWSLQNRGSKYWQEAWEDKIKSVEMDVLGAPLFSNEEPVRNRHLWGAARYSVSKLAISLSDFTALVWAFLVWKSHPRPYFHADLDLSDWITLVAAGYVILVIMLGRAKWSRP